jgi:glucokinase
MTTSAYIGIDLGGTNVRVGALTPDARMLAFRDAPIEARQGPQAGIEKIAGLIETVCAGADVRPLAIGIGATGPIDRARGAIQNPYTLPTWEDVDIVSMLSARFGVPATLENDADAAALGESWAGAGRDVERLIMVTLGTGVGFAFILNGAIYRGMGGVHPEGGHIILDPSGPECYCGARGCWESLCSGTAIGAYAREQAAKSPTLMLELAGSLETIDGGTVARAARQGDGLALEVIERTATYNAYGLLNLITLFVPERIIFTGGAARSFDLMEARIRETLERCSLMVPAKDVQLGMASLGQQAGMFGAARAAMQI